MSEELEDRRATDKRIEEIHNDVKEISRVLQGENGICVRLAVCERSNKATQKELEDHKENHKENKENRFRIMDVILSIGMIILAAFDWLKK